MLRNRIVLMGMTAFIAVVGSRRAVSQHRASTPVDGVWEYINPGMRGQAFITEGRYVFFSTQDGATPGAMPNALAHPTFTVQAGTFSVADTIVTSTNEYASDPGAVGRTWRWSYSVHGDTCTYHALDAAGHATFTGRAVRRRAAR